VPKRQKAPSGAFWRSSPMHLCSGAPMHFLSGVDTDIMTRDSLHKTLRQRIEASALQVF